MCFYPRPPEFGTYFRKLSKARGFSRGWVGGWVGGWVDGHAWIWLMHKMHNIEQHWSYIEFTITNFFHTFNQWVMSLSYLTLFCCAWCQMLNIKYCTVTKFSDIPSIPKMYTISWSPDFYHL
jgi:hypothetical protein